MMKPRLVVLALIGLASGVAAIAAGGSAASACGGLFCQNDPVNQAAERIVFHVNDDESVTSLIQIQYSGSAEDFSWILPIPEAIGADDLAVPDDGEQVFTDLHDLTDVRIIAPPMPDCAEEVFATGAVADSAEDESGVEVFASGEVGPFGFDVIGSEDPMALIGWLRDNNYRVEPQMEPLIDVYVEEQFAFIAMRLLNGQDVDAISPIEVTYPGTEPMIPLRLTAVAANPGMPVFVWIFHDTQAVPANFETMEIATEEITFNTFGGNDYQQLVQQRADALGGRAFITEFAGPANTLDLARNPYLRDLAQDHPYVTRLATTISPEEMTVDPVFSFDQSMPDVSNVRDASELRGLYDCERDGGLRLTSTDAIDPVDPETGGIAAVTPDRPAVDVGRNRLLVAVVAFVLGGAVVGAAVLVYRNVSPNQG